MLLSMRNLLWYFLQISLWVVALMSGILSLARELLLIYRGQQVQQRSLFWNCIIIAFVVSATSLWILEHQKLIATQGQLQVNKNELDRERNNNAPQLVGEIEN